MLNFLPPGSVSPTKSDALYLSLPHEAADPSNLAFESAYFAVPVWAHWLSLPSLVISLPFSVFPQIRQVPPCSEIWHKDLKFQRTLCYLSFPALSLSLSHCMILTRPPWWNHYTERCELEPCSHLLRKVFPKGLSLRKGLLGSTIRAFPGITLSTSPCMMAVKQSVVGSGPTLLPGISCSSRYLSRTQKFVSDFFLQQIKLEVWI